MRKFFTISPTFKSILNFSGSTVNVLGANGQEKPAKILGIDDFGFLKIQLDDTKKIESVQPDGNSFDMLRGLIIPKQQ